MLNKILKRLLNFQSAVIILLTSIALILFFGFWKKEIKDWVYINKPHLYTEILSISFYCPNGEFTPNSYIYRENVWDSFKDIENDRKKYTCERTEKDREWFTIFNRDLFVISNYTKSEKITAYDKMVEENTRLRNNRYFIESGENKWIKI